MAKPRVFVSSTYVDLKETREDVIKYLESVGFETVAFEKGGIGFLSDQPLDEDCYNAIPDCDYYILILGCRYGAPSYEDKIRNRVRRYNSITRKEFQRAKEEGVPSFYFVQDKLNNDYGFYSKNNRKTGIKYSNVDNPQILPLLRTVKESSDHNFIHIFSSSHDIISHLRSQFSSILHNQSKLIRANTGRSTKAPINPLKLSYFINQKKIMTINDLSLKTKIHVNELSRLQKLSKKSLRAGKFTDMFPYCELSSITAIERALSKEGQLRIGQVDDIHSKYLGPFTTLNHRSTAQQFGEKCGGSGIKISTVIFDFDGTITKSKNKITTWEMIWEKLGYSADDCKQYHSMYRRGEITHREWCSITAEKFNKAGINRATLDAVCSGLTLRNGATDLIERLYKDYQIFVHILSGSIDHIITRTLMDQTFCIKTLHANKMIWEGSRLKKIQGTPYDFEGKALFVRNLIQDHRLHPLEVLYVGNSSNDVWVANSGARTVCVDQHMTDPDETSHWSERLKDHGDLRGLIEHVETGSNDIFRLRD